MNGLISNLKFLGKLLGIAAVFACGATMQQNGLLADIAATRDDLWYLSVQTLELVAISSLSSVIIGIPIGVFLTRKGSVIFRAILSQVVKLGTTIPTLAVLAIVMTFLGPGTKTAVLGLTWLTMLPVVLNTNAGIRAVPIHLVEAAQGMGMTPLQILVQVELPNALFIIFAGIRTALTVNIGTVPLVFLIGGGGLGEMIFTGIGVMDSAMLLAGAGTTALLAVLVDRALGMAQYLLVPRGVRPVA